MLYDLSKYKQSKKSKADLDHLLKILNNCSNDLIYYIDKEDICRIISVLQGYAHKYEIELSELEYKIEENSNEKV